MEFIDHTGHIFSLPTFNDDPIALRYTENDYIFWIKDNPVSIDNYYILPIRFILNYDNLINTINEIKDEYPTEYQDKDLFDLNISIDSQFYKLISPKYIQQKLEANQRIDEPIEFNIDNFKSELTLDDFYFNINNEGNNLLVTNNNTRYVMFPFYVIGHSKIVGTFLSNIMIKYSTKKKEIKTQKIELDRDGMYNYLLNKTLSNIKIYHVDPETNKEELWHTIPTGYNAECNEIITADQENMRYRIHNWGNSGKMASDVYHYIYRIPKEKWLKKGEKYRFEGTIYQSCNYCSSPILVNHDGGYGSNYSLLDPNGVPYYLEDYEYNEETEEYTHKYETSQFVYGMLLGIYSHHSSGDGYTFLEDGYFTYKSDIRDISFDIDNKDMVNAKNGGVIEESRFLDDINYTQITVGCSFIDECEELIINGKNLGINLPKEIIKSIYQSSFYNKYVDEDLFKLKMKELLLNYMSIKGECGNFKSLVNSLKWFGWEDKVEISKLLKTDNEFQNQFILDYFDIKTDLKETYKYFTTTNLISLSVKGNNETGDIDEQNYDINHDFIGEGKPILEDLFDKIVYNEYDGYKFYHSYYAFMFNELALKLDCLAYYYQRYFLPIHLKINRASIEYKVYTNTIKHSSYAYNKIIEKPVFTHINSTQVYFGSDQSNNDIDTIKFNEVLFYKSIHYIDNKFNEFSNYNDNYNNEDLFYVNENCIYIPISIQDLTNSYVEYEYGEYIYFDDKFIKPYKFYIYDDINNTLTETENYQLATHYKMYYISEDYIELDSESVRYAKVTEGYFSCKIMLSYFKETKEGTEEIYLITDNTFSFYQSPTQFYKNYVIIPRLIKDKSFDWLNTKFKLSLLINNKWYEYYFIVRTPNIYLELGKLEYKYLIDSSQDFTMFNQVKEIIGNKIYFKSFMYQPDLVSIDTLFYDKDQDRVLTFLDKLTENDTDKQMNDFYNKYFINKVNIPYNRNIYNKVHIFDLCKRITIDDKNTYDLPHHYNLDSHGEYIGYTDEGWDELDAVKEFNKIYGPLLDGGKLANFSDDRNINYVLETKFTDDTSLDIGLPIRNVNGHIYNTIKDFWDFSDTGNESIQEHANCQIFATMFFVDFRKNNFPFGTVAPDKVYQYIYKTYEVLIIKKTDDDPYINDISEIKHLNKETGEYEYDYYNPETGEGRIIYHIMNRWAPDYLCQLIKKQLKYTLMKAEGRTDEYIEANGGYNYNMIADDPDNIYHYFERYKLERLDDGTDDTQARYKAVNIYNVEEELQKIPYEHQSYEEELTEKEVKLYRLFFNSNGKQIFNLNEPIDYDLYLMHDNIYKSQKYWYVVAISKYPISLYTDNQLKISIEEQDVVDSTDKETYVLKYSGYSTDKFLINRMNIIPSNGMNHFNQDDIVVATIGNNNYQFNIDLTTKYEIKHISSIAEEDTVRSNANIVIISNNNINDLYTPGYYNITLNYTINGLNDQVYTINGKYRINLKNTLNVYPVLKEIINIPKTISYDNVISDLGILYESSNGTQTINTNILDPSLGWHPIGIKIINKKYFDNSQDYDIYMGLKLLDVDYPDTGNSGKQSSNKRPRFGFAGIDIPNLKNYNGKTCYQYNENHEKIERTNIYVQTDNLDYIGMSKDENGNPRWPAPNGRAYMTGSIYSQANILNDDDTLNKDLVDETCAAFDYHGYENTQKIINAFDLNNPKYSNWKTIELIPNDTSAQFSPVAACAWRYHTNSTRQGDWYVPAFAEILFASYNYKKLSEKFEEIAQKYPQYCNPELLTIVGGNGLWTSTESNANNEFDIHPQTGSAHQISKINNWISIPYIRVKNGKTVSNNSSNNSGNNSGNDVNYLTFTAEETCKFTFNKSGIKYSINNGVNWITLEANEFTPEIPQRATILWKGSLKQDNRYIEESDITCGIGTFQSTGKYVVSGNVMTLIDEDNPTTTLEGRPFIFYRLFYNNANLTDASSMILPAMSLDQVCYGGMFGKCSNLIEGPNLPATQLADLCYYRMFEGCSSLERTNDLVATHLPVSCYFGMFKDCTSLLHAPKINATTLSRYSCCGMFYNCQKMTTSCPTLWSEQLEESCYEGMFSDCYKLESIPSIMGKTLAKKCCYGMFSNCKTIRRVDLLPALELVEECYGKMFEQCKDLSYICALFTTTPSTEYTDGWIAGVSLSGTFVKNKDATWENRHELFAIPPGWEVIDYEPITPLSPIKKRATY